MSMFRSKKLTDSARDQACVLCGRQDETICAAHCNDMEFRGMGLKAPDCLTAWVCQGCHDQIDGRQGGLSKEEKRAMWDRAFKRTVVQWFDRGIVKVA